MDERSQQMLRELMRLGNQERRTTERLTLAIQGYRASCMDRDPASIEEAQNRVSALTEALLDTIQLQVIQRFNDLIPIIVGVDNGWIMKTIQLPAANVHGRHTIDRCFANTNTRITHYDLGILEKH